MKIKFRSSFLKELCKVKDVTVKKQVATLKETIRLMKEIYKTIPKWPME